MDELNKAESVTNIASGTQVKADIQTKSDIRIAGTVEGNISTEKKLILTGSGRIKGSVIAQEAILEGKFTGELRIKEQVTVRRTAIIDGVIFSKQVSVEENAEVNAIAHIGPDVDVLSAKPGKTPQRPELKQAVDKAKEVTENVKEEENKPAQTRFVGTVLVGIPSSDIDKTKASEIKTTCDEFMSELGFELEIFDEPVFDPYFQKFAYVRKSSESEKDFPELFKKGKESLETALLNKGNTGEASQLQNKADKLIQLFRSFDQFAAILGNIVLVQQMEDEVQSIAAELIPEQLATELKKDPELVTDPARVYTYVDN